MLASRVMAKVLVVGAGATGAVTAAMLRDQLPKNTHIEIWDKARGSGGRMGTSRGPESSHSTVDLGAQYISSTPENFKAHEQLYTDLLKAGVLDTLKGSIEGDKEHPEGTQHFVTPKGSGALVKYFLEKSGATTRFGTGISDVSESDSQWTVSTGTDTTDSFDCVVFTMPVPQILQLKGTVKDLIDSKPEIKANLASVSYSSRFAVGLFYKPGTNIDVPWSAKYFFDNPCIRFVSVDNKKRNADSPDVGPSVCVHTSVPFSLSHLEEDKDTVGPQYIMPQVREILPELPEPASVKNHKWRYSQVHKSYPGQPAALMLSRDPLLVCGGDAFISSGFDNCVKSASEAVKIIMQHIQVTSKF